MKYPLAMNTTIKTPSQHQLIKLYQWRIYLRGYKNLYDP